MRIGRKRTTGKLYRRGARVCAQRQPCLRFAPDFGWDGTYVTVDCPVCTGVQLPTVMVMRVQVIDPPDALPLCRCVEGYYPLYYTPITGFGADIPDWATLPAIDFGTGADLREITGGYVICWPRPPVSLWNTLRLFGGFGCTYRDITPTHPWTLSMDVLNTGSPGGVPIASGSNVYHCFQYDGVGTPNNSHLGAFSCDPLCATIDIVQSSLSGPFSGCPCATCLGTFSDPCGFDSNVVSRPITLRITVTVPWLAGYSCDGSFTVPDFSVGAGTTGNTGAPGTVDTTCGCCGDGGSGSGDGSLDCDGPEVTTTCPADDGGSVPFLARCFTGVVAVTSGAPDCQPDLDGFEITLAYRPDLTGALFWTGVGALADGTPINVMLECFGTGVWTGHVTYGSGPSSTSFASAITSPGVVTFSWQNVSDGATSCLFDFNASIAI